MLGSNKKVLIVNFNFPPSPSIGGRRWSYLAKYLEKLGCDIHVITSDFPDIEDRVCPWNENIDKFKKNINYLPHKTPFHVVNKRPKTLFSKVQYRLSLRKARSVPFANPYDRSLHFADEAYLFADRYITQKGIKNVILTGGPFHFVYVLSKLKNHHQINLIVDFRDPWTENLSVEDLDWKLNKIERQKNTEVICNADKIFVPVLPMKDKIFTLWPSIEDKLNIISHGYDNEIFGSKIISKGSFDKWYYAGTFYPEMDNEINLLKNLLNQLSIKLDVFSYSNVKTYEKVEFFHSFGMCTQSELLEKTLDHGISLIIFPPEFRDYKSSKFFELIRSGKFLLYVGFEGVVSNFIEEHNLGFCLLTNKIKQIDQDIKKELKLKFTNFEPNPDLVSSYSFQSLAKLVFKCLK